MKSSLLNKRLRSVVCILAAIIIVPFVISLFVDSPNVLTLNRFLGKGGFYDRETDSVSFLDVGEGDAVLLRSNGGFTLIDTGDGVSSNIVRSLKNNGVERIDTLILTHWHNDHVGGALDIFKEFNVEKLIIPKFPDSLSGSYEVSRQISSAAEQTDTRVIFAEQGLSVCMGDFMLTCIYYTPCSENENNGSAIYMAECRSKRFLLTADAESELEKELINSGLNLDCDVLKVAHHGSDTSSTPDFIKAATPELAVISVGNKNEYGHPDSSVLNRFNENEITVYRTDKCGDINITVLENELKVSAELLN